jgi:hypothetical protein
MFRAPLCPSSGEQEQDWLKLHVKMPATLGEKKVGCIVVAATTIQSTSCEDACNIGRKTWVVLL